MALACNSPTKWSYKRCMSQAAYELKLDRELANFKEDLDDFLVGKENFVEDFYRRLKAVLGRCKSWRCQGALGINGISITSRKQIEELIHWDRSTRLIKNRKQAMRRDVTHQPKCMLVQFVEACDASVSLHETFCQLIYKPLRDVFYEAKIKPLAKELGRILWRWETLLVPGPQINHRLFSPESAKALYYMKHKSRASHFNLVLRLIPDLALKSYECLELAREWRGFLGTQGYARQMERTMRQWQMVVLDQEISSKKAKDEDPSLKTLEAKLEEAEHELQESSSKFQTLDNEVNALESRLDEISSEQDEFRSNLKSACEEKLVVLRAVSRSKQDVDFLRGEVRVEQRHLHTVRHRLLQAQSRQSRSFEREVKRPVFEKQFKDGRERCTNWQRELLNAEFDYDSHFGRHAAVRDRLNSARTEMGVSKSQKALLSRNLSRSREKKDTQAKKRIQSANQIRGIRAELRHVNGFKSCADTKRREEKRDDEALRPSDVSPFL